jgi:diguanylate cyclase (GGDEF)-like protein
VTAPALAAQRPRTEYAVLGDRLGLLLLLRVAFAVTTVGFASTSLPSPSVPLERIAGLAAGYLFLAVTLELLGRRAPRLSFAALTVLLLVDGVFLAAATYATGGTGSPLRFLIYLHLIAVSLLGSYRTGLKIALWQTLLLFVVLYAQAAGMLPPVDVQPGAIAMDQMPVINVIAFWLFALATSLFSAVNERELRHRRADLEALVCMGAQLDDEDDPMRQAGIVLDGLAGRYAFPRAAVLGVVEDGVTVLGTRGLEDEAPGEIVPADPLLLRAWSAREPLAVRRLDPAVDRILARVLPAAHRVIVAPMIADGRPVGALVLEYPGRAPGVERRVMSVVAQAAGVAALNLRNAFLLQRIQDLAERDALTGAANRRSFQGTLERMLASAAGRRHTVAAVLFIDLDDFKVINDTLGHAAGDDLLVAVTERISGLVRDGDVVARLGGDEFAILTEDVADLRRSRAMAERLVRELRAPFQVGGQSVTISASIGVASASDAVDGATDMVRNADVAMYLAKAGGKAGYSVFDPGMHRAVRARHEMAMDLQHAVERQQLHLRYQPIVDLATGRLAGVEALVRWQHPERGLITPGDFIEIAEEHGSILPIGRWVLRETCHQAAEWDADGSMPAEMFVTVNVSAREVQEAGFVEGVRDALEGHGVAPARLVIELTETALLRATPATVATLQGLRDIGVRVVIDDFGTGFFSLSHLRQFPVDALKIASEFTQEDDSTAARGSALSAAIVAMAGSLGIETVAEGIETPAHAARMRTLTCTYGQGYFYAHPLLPDELLAVLRAQEVQAAVETGATVDGTAATVALPPARRTRGSRRQSALAGSGASA